MPELPGYRVNIINPPQRRKGKKTVAKRRRRRRSAPKRRRRRNPVAAAPAAPRRRRRTVRSNPRRRRRRNPSGGGGTKALFRSGLSGSIGRLAGTILSSFAVQRFGVGGTLYGDPRVSPTYGQSWPFRNYLACLVAGFGAAKLMQKMNWGRKHAVDVWKGSVDLALSKLAYTEVFARWPWVQQVFGALPGNVEQFPAGTYWLNRGGAYQSMMGYEGSGGGMYGQLVSADQLDGGMGQLVSADQLDGIGHYLPGSTPVYEAKRAAWQGTGSKNPYAAAYMGD